MIVFTFSQRIELQCVNGYTSYLSNVSRGIDKTLKLLVSNFVDVHVEGVYIDQPLRTLAVGRDAWVVCPHEELSSRNQQHLTGQNTAKLGRQIIDEFINC